MLGRALERKELRPYPVPDLAIQFDWEEGKSWSSVTIFLGAGRLILGAEAPWGYHRETVDGPQSLVANVAVTSDSGFYGRVAIAPSLPASPPRTDSEDAGIVGWSRDGPGCRISRCLAEM